MQQKNQVRLNVGNRSGGKPVTPPPKSPKSAPRKPALNPAAAEPSMAGAACPSTTLRLRSLNSGSSRIYITYLNNLSANNQFWPPVRPEGDAVRPHGPIVDRTGIRERRAFRVARENAYVDVPSGNWAGSTGRPGPCCPQPWRGRGRWLPPGR